MIATILAWLVAKGVPAKAAKPFLIAAAVLGLLAMLGTAKCAYDRSVIEKHSARQEAANAKADRKADAKAAEQRRTDDARINQEADELRKAQANATTDTDRRLARHRCLRLQQSARADGREPPACG